MAQEAEIEKRKNAPWAPPFIHAAAAFVGEDPFLLNKIMGAEWDPKKYKNDNSSASGVFQFTDETWNGKTDKNGKRLPGMVDKYGEKYGLTSDGRTDPNQQAVAAALLVKENRAALTKFLKRDPNDEELYFAHFLGAAGAIDFLNGLYKIDKNAPATKYLRDSAVESNKKDVFTYVYKDADGNEVTGPSRTAQELFDRMSGKLNAKRPHRSPLPPLPVTAPDPAPPNQQQELSSGSQQ